MDEISLLLCIVISIFHNLERSGEPHLLGNSEEMRDKSKGQLSDRNDLAVARTVKGDLEYLNPQDMGSNLIIEN
jgi:hypothetical protein